MSEHHGSVVVYAPVHQVYTFFTHFNDFPKFMSFVKEVTYYDEQRSHWVAQAFGTHEWDAVNEDWIEDQQIGWRSTNGLENHGRVKFTALTPDRTQVDAFISYTPPAGMLGAVVEQLGVDTNFRHTLQEDLQHFATLVEEAPAGALDPMQSHYLFHNDSAVARGIATERQQEAMQHDPMMSADSLRTREGDIDQQRQQREQVDYESTRTQEQQQAAEQRVAHEKEAALRQQALRDQQEAQASRAAMQDVDMSPTEPHPVYDTIGGRNASVERTAIGDQDSRSERFPHHNTDPMTSRAPGHNQQQGDEPGMAETERESPWSIAMRGGQTQNPEPDEQTQLRVQDQNS